MKFKLLISAFLFATTNCLLQTFSFAQVTANFGWTVDTMYCGNVVIAFHDSSTGNVNSWQWDFGDGATSTQQNPIAFYYTGGVYNVHLIVSNAGGSKDSLYRIIKIPLPAGTFTFTPSSGCNPLTICFDVTDINTEYNIWDFDDGHTAQVVGDSCYTYTSPGTYTPRCFSVTTLPNGQICTIPNTNISGTINLCVKAQDTIPNGDFENWTSFILGYENPNGWTTNNADFSTMEVKSDTNAYHGNYAIKLINAGTTSAWAQVKLPITTHPFNLIGYVKCSLADSTDTVSVKIILLKNGLPVDSGVWFGTSSISSYIQVKIPISQNASTIDSAIIVITGGSHLTNNQLGMGTKFWVDYLSLDSAVSGIKNINKTFAIKMFPNPFSSSTTLQADNPLKNATLRVYNSLGQEVKQITNITGQSITLNRDNLPSGLYFIRLIQDDKIFATDKLVITDN